MTAQAETITSARLKHRIADAEERLEGLEGELTRALRDSAKAELEGRLPGCAIRDLRAEISGLTDEIAGLNKYLEEVELAEVDASIELLEPEIERLWDVAAEAKHQLSHYSRTGNEFGSGEHVVAEARERWRMAEERHQSAHARLRTLKSRRAELDAHSVGDLMRAPNG